MNGLLTVVDFGSRGKRRKAIMPAVNYLSAIRDAEQKCLENIPENFRGSETFEIGECAVDVLDEIIDLLGDVY